MIKVFLNWVQKASPNENQGVHFVPAIKLTVI